MGCQPSQLQKPLGIRINILDSNFMKQNLLKIRQKMERMDIKYVVYLSLSCFGDDMSKVYTNQIITTEELLRPLLKQLKELNFNPNVYVLASKQTAQQKLQDTAIPIKYFKNYLRIIEELSEKTIQKGKNSINPTFQKSKEKIVLKILRKIDKKSSQQLIFQQTLRAKKIKYQFYLNFSDLQTSQQTNTCNFIVTDYVYHREVVRLVQNTNSRVICFCQLDKDQSYDARVYFVTNNFLQIVSQIVSQQKLFHFNQVKCSKAYIYTNEQNGISQYAKTIESFDFQVKIHSDLSKIIKESKYFFAITIIINPEQRKCVQEQLEASDYMFKTKIVEIKKGTQNSIKGLRKTLKELKRGYRAEKGLTRSIDIIDKHFDNVKFQSIKKQLSKYQIQCYGYNNLNQYIKGKKFISPFIICNYDQRTLIVRYLKQIQSKTKVILFCNKNSISSQLKENKVYCFVGSHFGKILNFIRKNKVYNPYIMDESQCQLRQKKDKLKMNNKRISAIKWSGQNQVAKQDSANRKGIAQLYKDFQFLNIRDETAQSQIIQIQRQAASMFKFGYSPLAKHREFKQNLVLSLKKLKSLFRVDYPEGDFRKLIRQIQNMSTLSLVDKVRQFFSSQNQMGLKINQSLINVETLTKQQVESLRQYLFIVNYNFLSVYRDYFVGKIKLFHYLQSDLILKCQVGSYILNKNYCVFYQSQEKQNIASKVTFFIVQLQLEVNGMAQKHPQFNSYFTFNDKFIFSPYSQFLIKAFRKQKHTTIIQVTYKKNIQFLKSYFSENVFKQKQSIMNVYDEELQRSKAIQYETFFFDQNSKEKFVRNMLRTKAMICFQNGKLQQAIRLQKQVINRQQNLQNFDSYKLEWLNYELACFYFKDQRHSECKRVLEQLFQSQPDYFLKAKINQLKVYYKQNQKSSSRNLQDTKKKHQQIFRVVVLEPAIVHYNSSKTVDFPQMRRSQFSDQQNMLDLEQIQKEFPCLELNKIQDFQTQYKENIC